MMTFAILLGAIAALALCSVCLFETTVRSLRMRHHDHLIPGTPRSYRRAY